MIGFDLYSNEWLVGNALKYTHSGLVSVKLFAKESVRVKGGREGALVCLQVEDTGIGMSEEFVANDLFRPFRQADCHSSGTGLGMSIVGEVAKEFNGSVDVKSKPKRGTVVTFQFTVLFTDQPPNIAENDRIGSDAPKLRQLWILNMTDGAATKPNSSSTRAVKDSVQRTAAQWLGCEVVSSRDMTPSTRGSLCAVSENDLVHLHSLGTGAVKSLISSLAATGGSGLLVLGQSIASAQPIFEFKDFPIKPIYIHQPIGPRKLMRVISNSTSSTITRNLSDYALHDTRAQPSSGIIKGDTSESECGNLTATGPYSGLPKAAEAQHERRSSSSITPISFLNVSSQTIPETSAQPTRAPHGQEGDHILLVEDNTINMRVRSTRMFPCVYRTSLIIDSRTAIDSSHEETGAALPMRSQRPRSAQRLQSITAPLLPYSHGHEHAGKRPS